MHPVSQLSQIDILTAQEEWRRMSSGHTAVLSPDKLAYDAASSFIYHALSRHTVRLEHIDLLCEMAASKDAAFSKPATSALYTSIVEVLCDDFSSLGVETCNLVLTRILSFMRAMPEGKETDQLLNTLGFPSSDSILKRYEAICRTKPISERTKRNIKKIIILSRATMGADIAINSIILNRLYSAFPNAELILIGSKGLKDIFSNIPRVYFTEFRYERYGSISDRTTGWPLLYKTVQQELQGLEPEEILIFDPDTRLTQLGLLPLCDDRSICYFSSRKSLQQDFNPSLTVLTNQWLNSLLGENKMSPPKISLPEPHVNNARTAINRLKKAGCAFIIAINLGVGGNIKKRIPRPFEEELLPALLCEKDTIIFLDSGNSSEGLKRIRSLLAEAASRSIPTNFVTEDMLSSSEIKLSHGIIGFRGSIGAIGAVIHEADVFFGYDSMCQHMAAAFAIPSVIVFAGAPNPRFLARWRPGNPETIPVISVADSASLTPSDISRLVEQVAAEIKQIRIKRK